ncbi:MAG TPA: response regulator transcription factor [Pseudonocardiaceae bacterium]|nr:response regulator transcription factor [Pseudonocardiaceae bacterium]
MTLVDLRPRAGSDRRPRPRPLKVLLADGQPVVRDGLRALFGSVEGITVVADASSAADVLREVLSHRPDVLVLDLELPGPDRIAVCHQVARAAPETRVLIFTRFADACSVTAAMRAGARGYLLKRAGGADVLRAVRSVAAGEVIFGADVANSVTELFFAPESRSRAPFPELTARERQVLELIAAGLPNSAIARRLDLATKTVSNHISAVLAKLRVADRATAIIRARDAGLGRPPH